MMHFRPYLPAEPLRPYIRQYLHLKAEGSTDTMTPPEGDPRFVDGLHTETLLPTIGMMVFVKGAEMRTEELHIRRQSSIYVVGPRLSTFGVTTVSGWFEGFHIDFEPGGMRALLGYDMHAIKGHIMGLDQLQDESLRTLGQRFREMASEEACVAALDDYFVDRHNPRNTTNAPIIQRVVAAIDAAKGDIAVSQMCDIACMSERQFRRVFSEYVGLTPKEFIRIRRFHLSLQYLQRLAREGKTVDALEVAIRFGYYDLSHMAAEFRALGCTTPMQFRKLGIPFQDDFSQFFG